MPEISAGLLLFKLDPGLKLFLSHPGGPYWANKDAGAWTVPKGLIEDEEDKIAAATREFEEEIGFRPEGRLLELGSIKQKGGKVVHSWAVEGDLPENHRLNSNRFEMEWPPDPAGGNPFPRSIA